jgi:hypothetical protein
VALGQFIVAARATPPPTSKASAEVAINTANIFFMKYLLWSQRAV